MADNIVGQQGIFYKCWSGLWLACLDECQTTRPTVNSPPSNSPHYELGEFAPREFLYYKANNIK